MLSSPTVSSHFALVHNSFCFFRKHFPVIIILGLVAAFGRVVQLGGFGKITPSVNLLMELLVEAARGLLFLYILGMASIKNGFLRVKSLFTGKTNRKLLFKTALHQLIKQWRAVLLNLAGFIAVAWAFNYLIDLLAYKTCFYLTLKNRGVLDPAASEWAILLFFKNLSVIPFTFIFETLLLLWITGKLNRSAQTAI